MKSNSKKILVVVVVALAIVSLICAYIVSPSSFRLSLGGSGPTIVTPGWEIYDQIVGVRQEKENHQNQIFTQSSQFTSPNFISAPLWKFDLDNPSSGVSTIEATVGDIHHVDFTGRDVPNSQAAQTITVTRGNHTYILDDHIYLLTVMIRSIADFQQVGGAGNMPNFNHETSWPYTFGG